MNKGTGKRLLAIVMALSIVMAMLPVSALGAGRDGPVGAPAPRFSARCGRSCPFRGISSL